MTLRFQRLLLILLSLLFLLSAILLILFNSKKNIVFFYTPSELLENNVELNKTIRIGAFVQKGSFKKIADRTYEFNLSDKKNFIKVMYTGFLPDLFREEQGAVIEGVLISKKLIKASTVYAKHDENYMPNSIKKSLELNEYWQRKY